MTSLVSGSAPQPPDARPRSSWSRRRPTIALLVGIGVIAFLLRFAIMARGGGTSGLGGYDDDVYYAASDALVHGRLPYRDFLLIQPPLIAVVTAPFAWLGSITSDPLGFAVARLAFMAIGGVNAVLCAAILRRFGWTAAVVGGLGYAMFHPAVYAERSVLLEPLGTLGILAAVLLLQRAPERARLDLAAGIAAGLAAGAKIWYIVPAAVLLLAAGRTRGRYIIGVALGGCAIYLPFLAAAPQRMVQQVVLDQLGRGGGSPPNLLHRVTDILGARTTAGIPATAIGAVLLVVVAATVITTLCTPGGRTFGALALATIAVLLASPSWFPHYTALTAPPLALCVGLAAGRLAGLLRRRSTRAVLTATLLLGIAATNEAGDLTPVGTRVPTGLSAAAEVVPGCVTADDPGALIEMDVLSRDLQHPACPVWPDVTGWTYDPKDLARTAGGGMLSRARNDRWQHDVLAFLRAGATTIHIRSATGLDEESKRTLDDGAVLFHRGAFVVHATGR